ncbi:MAG: CDP-alcohol phosphatidyltransferase family protein [Rhabdochlamydiaceae bacterium]
MTFANYFTLIRILLAPIFLIISLYHKELGVNELYLPIVLITIAIVSEFSDAADGFFARKFNQVTDFGKLIDPLADSIFKLTIFLSFTQSIVKAPLFFVMIIFYRDALVSTLRSVCALKGFALAARKSGKLKAVFLAFVAFSVLLLQIFYNMRMVTLSFLQDYAYYSLMVCAIYAFVTGFEYFYVNRLFIRKALRK